MIFLKFFLRKYGVFIRNRRVSFVIVFAFIFTYTTIGFYLLEKEINPEIKLSDALWWSIVTMTTVGYGDITPRSELTRMLIGYPTILLGVVFVGYILSDISAKIFEENHNKRKGLKKVKAKDHLVFIRFVGEERVKSIISEMDKEHHFKGVDIVLIDDQIREISTSLGVNFVHGDPTLQETLKKANITQARSVIIFGQTDTNGTVVDLKSIAAVLAVRELTTKVPIISECADPKYLPILKSAGSTHAVCLEGMREQLMVQELLDPGVVSIVHELTSNLSGNQLYIVSVPPSMHTYQDIKNFCQHQDACLLGIRRKNENYLAPNAAFSIKEGDSVICIAKERPTLA